MPTNVITEDHLCEGFVKALYEQRDKIEDVVFDDVEKSKNFVTAMIPDGGVVNYRDNNDTVEYTRARQAFRQYRDQDATQRDLVSGQVPGRDENGRTGLFDAEVNEVDPNACAGSCLFRFGQGFKIYTTKDYELQMTTPEVCAREYIRDGEAHVAGYFKGLMEQYREYGKDNFEANLMNLVIANGAANATVLTADYFEVTEGGFFRPPENRLSIHFLKQYRQYMVREGGLTEDDYLEISCPEQDWRDAVMQDQITRMGMGGQTVFNEKIFDDSFGKLKGKKYHEYDSIRCVFDELPVKGYFKAADVVGGEQRYDFVRVYHWKNEPNEIGGLSAEPNHSYDQPKITVDGLDHDMCTFAFVINKKSFTRFGLGAAKKYEGAPAMSQNFSMKVIDGYGIPKNDYNDKFRVVTRHAFRFKVEKAELSGAIAYRSSALSGYVIAPNVPAADTAVAATASPEVYEKCLPSDVDRANADCVGKEVDNDGVLVTAGTKGQVSLEPCAAATTAYIGADHTVELEVVRTGNTNGAGTVDYAFNDGTATNATEYTGVDGTITWADGESGSKAITVTISDPLVASVNFDIELSNATGTVELGNCVQTVVTIEDAT